MTAARAAELRSVLGRVLRHLDNPTREHDAVLVDDVRAEYEALGGRFMIHTRHGRRVFRSFEDARQYAAGYFDESGIVLGIVEVPQ